MALNVISLIANFWNVETPAWLLSVGEVEQAKKNLAYIAKWNGVQDFSIVQLLPDPEETIRDPDHEAEQRQIGVEDEITEE